MTQLYGIYRPTINIINQHKKMKQNKIGVDFVTSENVQGHNSLHETIALAHNFFFQHHNLLQTECCYKFEYVNMCFNIRVNVSKFI